MANREALWSAVEAGEKRKDAQLARDIEFALPQELSREHAIALARDFVRSEFARAAWSPISTSTGSRITHMST